MTGHVGSYGAGNLSGASGVVQLRDVSLRFVGPDGQPIEVLRDLNLTLSQGSLTCIVGPSGCGKSTLLRIIAGLEKPTTGEVLVGGSVVHSPGRDRGMVFQQPALYPWQSVLDNVAFGLRLRGVSRSERRKRALEYLRLVGLADWGQYRPYQLSGGMQQRVQLARVLASDPQVVLMDEPFAALDAITRGHLQDELLRIWSETGKTVVFVTHSVEEALVLGTRVVALGSGSEGIVLDEEISRPTSGSTVERPQGIDVVPLARRIMDAIGASTRGVHAEPM